MKRKIIASALASVMLLGTAAQAAWVFEERYTEVAQGVNEIGRDGNYITTAVNTYAVSHGEDIHRRHVGPSFEYDGEKLVKVVTTPAPTRDPSAPTPTPRPTYTPAPTAAPEIVQTEGDFSVMQKRNGYSYNYALSKGSQMLTEYKYDYLALGYDKNGKLLIAAMEGQGTDNCVLLDENMKVIVDRGYKYIGFDALGRIFASKYFYYTHANITRGTYLDENYEEIRSLDEYTFEKVDDNHPLYIVFNNSSYEYYLLDETGNEIAGPAKDIDELVGGAYAAEYKTNNLVKDRYGKMVYASRYDVINPEGKLIAQTGSYPQRYKEKGKYILYLTNDSRSETTVIDNDGNELFHAEGRTDFDVLDPGGYRTQKNNKYAIVTQDGKLLTDFIYKHITSTTISDGVNETPCYCVSIDDGFKYLDADLNEYDISDESRVCYKVNGWNNEKFEDTMISHMPMGSALIDTKTNSYIIPYSDGYKLSASNGYILRTKDEKTSVLDRYGNVILDLDMEVQSVSDFNHGGARMLVSEAYRDYFAVDEHGDNIFGNRSFWAVNGFGDDMFIVLTSGSIGVFKRLENPEAVNTDKRVYINGFEIPCFEVNGKAVITAEDLGGYGFDVIWNGEKQTLDISRNSEYYDVNPVDIPEHDPGSHYADISPSDISVFFNKHRMGAYNINGYMLINPEDMAGDGITIEKTDGNIYITVDGLELKN